MKDLPVFNLATTPATFAVRKAMMLPEIATPKAQNKYLEFALDNCRRIRRQ